jgi:hypothetical protein
MEIPTVDDEGDIVFYKKEVVAPEHGIHVSPIPPSDPFPDSSLIEHVQSLQWARNIAPQSGFLTLPTEIREKIYNLALTSQPNSKPCPFLHHIITPHRLGQKFISKTHAPMISQNRTLSLICRQTYVDVVGGGLLYKFGTFSFSSPQTMDNYLRVINPAHRACIRNVRLLIHFAFKYPILPKKIFQALSTDSLPSLQSLKITLDVNPWSKQGTSIVISRYVWNIDKEHVERFKKGNWKNWESLRGNLKEFYLVFSRAWIWCNPQQGHWVKEMEDEIKLRVLGSLAMKP